MRMCDALETNPIYISIGTLDAPTHEHGTESPKYWFPFAGARAQQEISCSR